MPKIGEYFFSLATEKRRGLVASVVKAFLFIFSLIYGLVAWALIFLKRRNPCRLSCKVISVGNLTLGGTGKTTTVEFVARYLTEQGRKVAVLSRGRTGAQNLGDEPAMLSKKLEGVPVIADTDRIRGARRAIAEHGADTVILDDGLQQWHIEKDLEIVTIDAGCPFGNGYLLPRGILRQPLSSLSQPGVFVLTKINLYPDTRKIKDTLARFYPSAQVIEALHQPMGFYELSQPQRRLPVDALAGQPVALFSGIGDPGSFEKLTSGLGAKVELSLRFGDHHHYTAADLEKISMAAKDKNINVLITTEKDAARFYDIRSTISDLRILVLQIQLGFKDDGKDRFYNRLRALYSL
ncbi:MAG: tetraacyldisaccharide 4'-kinase [Candidatus Omnitrophota bacterium]|nr:tetraacyldisaccharide 4'-kinase [Candidatus Omnitrophota bacterium]